MKKALVGSTSYFTTQKRNHLPVFDCQFFTKDAKQISVMYIVNMQCFRPGCKRLPAVWAWWAENSSLRVHAHYWLNNITYCSSSEIKLVESRETFIKCLHHASSQFPICRSLDWLP
jgi:hypothetical protein